MQTIKKILTKCKEDGTPPLLAILEYRNTPVDGLKSPAELMMSRQLRSILPATNYHLTPKPVDKSEVFSKRLTLQGRQKRYYDHHARPLESLNKQDHVHLQINKKWQPGKIVEIADTPRSYMVETRDGGTYRRNRRFIRKDNTTPEPPRQSPDQSPSTPSTELNPPAPVDTTSAPVLTTRVGRVVRRPKFLDE